MTSNFFFQRLTFPTNICEKLRCIQNPIEHLQFFLQNSQGDIYAGNSFQLSYRQVSIFRRSCLEIFCEKGVSKISSKFTGEQPCQSVISIKLLCSFILITLCHGCSTLDLLQIFRTPFPKNTSGGMFLYPATSLKERTSTQMFF